MKVALTGASGFVGQHVLANLLENGIETVAVTRNAANLGKWSAKMRIVEMDICNPPADCFERLGKPDVLIHLAWGGLPNYRSLHHFESELPGQYRFLKRMIETGLASLLVTGTCFEYGMQSGALSEDMPTRPANPYAYAKDALRRQLEFLQSTVPFQLSWARLFYMYGPGQSASSLYSQLTDAVLRGDKVFNMSGGEQLRDFLPVADVARHIVHLSGRLGGVINVCSGKPISVRSMVEQWLAENNWKIELNRNYYPYPNYEPMAFWGCAAKLASCDANNAFSGAPLR